MPIAPPDDILLAKAAIIERTLRRNIAIHAYRALDLEVLRALATDRWRSRVDRCRELGAEISFLVT